MKLLACIALALTLFACANRNAQTTQAQTSNPGLAQKLSARSLPPLPWDGLQSARSVPDVAVIPKTQQGTTVTLSWENPDADSGFAGEWISVVEASVGNAAWTEVVRLPYRATNQITLSNRPPGKEFYRFYNRNTNSVATP